LYRYLSVDALIPKEGDGLKLVMAQSNLTLFGGGERVVLKIAQRYGAKIYTAEYNPRTTFPEFRDLDVEVVGSKSFAGALPYGRVMQGLNYGLSFFNYRIKDDYDVINAHMAPSHWIRNRNERVVWYCHTPLRDVYDLYKFRLSLKKAYQKPVYVLGAGAVRAMDRGVTKKIEYIFANSANTRSRVARYYGRDAEVLNGGVDYGLYRDGGDGKYFFYPSRMSPNKRQEYAIRAFEAFKRRRKGYRLVLAGPVSKDRQFSSYYQDKIVPLARRVGDVEILGGVSDRRYRNLLSRATAVLYPPIDEDYGLVPLEGMASGKPVIAVNEGGPRDTIINGRTGFLVNGESEMAERMLYVSEHDMSKMGRSGMRRVRERYSWRSFFRVFDARIRKVAKRS
jgi:glycosyltransferase involved in cell wall biosynthesis